MKGLETSGESKGVIDTQQHVPDHSPRDKETDVGHMVLMSVGKKKKNETQEFYS